jgi:hypothetical protein
VVGLRDQINQKSAVTGLVVGGVVLILLATIYFQLRGNHAAIASEMQRYYTTDDGRTWFADSQGQVPPFDHNGLPAVICLVFKASTSAPFAGYLEKYTPQMHDEMTGVARPSGPVIPDSGALVKRPNDKNWFPLGSAAGRTIVLVKSPDGSSEPVEPVLP